MPPVLGPCVAVEQPLVVLRRSAGDEPLAVGDRRSRRAHRRPGTLRAPPARRRRRRRRRPSPRDGRLGGGGIGGDDDALAAGQAVGLDDDRQAQFARRARRRAPRRDESQIRARAVGTPARAMSVLREGLARLELRRGARRAEERTPGRRGSGRPRPRRGAPRARRPSGRRARNRPGRARRRGSVAATGATGSSRAMPGLPGAHRTVRPGSCARRAAQRVLARAAADAPALSSGYQPCFQRLIGRRRGLAFRPAARKCV